MNWLDVPPHWRQRGHLSPENSRRLVAYCQRLLSAASGETDHETGAAEWLAE